MALAPLLAALARVPRRSNDVNVWPRRAPAALAGFLLGVTTGVVYFAGTLYWIADVMVTYGGLNRFLAILVNLALVAFLALFPGLFAIALVRLVAALGGFALLLSPAVWVATELGRTHLFGGFPWVLLGYSQTPVLPIAQLASLSGVYGVSALVMFVNAALVYAVLGRGRRRVTALATAVAAVGAVAVWGDARIDRSELTRHGVPVKVGLIQGNIAQEDKWDPARAADIVDRYLRLSREAARRGARFIIWPESSTPFYFEEDPAGAEALRRLARENGADILFGSDQVVRGPVVRYYNAAYLVTSEGRTAAVYRKIHLVPFGEFVPLKSLLFFAGPLVESVSDFSAGADIVTLPVGGRLASTAICYEIVYPELIRRFVLAGSELLTTITNDAWYGRSSAPHQHFMQAAMRSIEQGRYLARAANTGISGIVDPYGRELARSKIFEPAVLVGEVRFLKALTVYARTGDLFAYSCVVCTAAALIATGRRGRAGTASRRGTAG